MEILYSMYLSCSVSKMLSVWSLKCPPSPRIDANWHYHGSISFALVFWYLLVISYWTILVSGCKCIPVQCPEKSTVACLISVPYVSALLLYTAMKAFVSTLPGCPFLDVLSCLPAPCCHFCSSLLLLPYLLDAELHSLATATASCWFLCLLGLCTVGSESKSNSLLNSWGWCHTCEMCWWNLIFLRWTVWCFAQLCHCDVLLIVTMKAVKKV